MEVRRPGPTSSPADTGLYGDELDLDDVFVRIRTAMMLGQRCGTRINQLVSPLWDDRGPIRHSIPGLLLLGDVAQLRWLRDDKRLHLAMRLTIDAAEIVLASLTAVRDDYDESAIPLFPGCALAVEAGARLGPAGLVVPAVNAVAHAVARRRRGHLPRTGLVGWQVAGAVGGMALAAYGRKRRAAELERHRRELSAQINRAELTGRNDIASRDVVVDEVQRAAVLIELGSGRPASNTAGDWKAVVGEDVRREFEFLGDVLARHQAAINSGPDLRSAVVFEPEGEAGTVVLAREQASALLAELARVQPRGRVAVQASVSRNVIEVTVGGEVVRLEPPKGDLKLTFDPIPGGFAWMALWLSVAGGSTRENVPRWASLGPAALALGAMGWSHAVGTRAMTRAPRDQVIGVAASLMLASTAVQTVTMRSPHAAGGTSRFPFTLSLRGYGLVALLAWAELSEAGRRTAVGAGAANVALGWALTPKPRSRREGIADLVWPIQAVLLAGSLAAAIDEDAEAVGRRIRELDDELLEQAHERGRRAALSFARSSLDAARRSFDDSQRLLDDALRAECSRRLEACDDLLRAAAS